MIERPYPLPPRLRGTPWVTPVRHLRKQIPSSKGFLFSSQLYAMWPHDEPMIAGMLSALDESLGDVARLQEQGRLQQVAGPQVVDTGFARLA